MVSMVRAEMQFRMNTDLLINACLIPHLSEISIITHGQTASTMDLKLKSLTEQLMVELVVDLKLWNLAVALDG